MDVIIIVNPCCVRGRFNDLLEGLRKGVIMLMATVYCNNIIPIEVRKEKTLHRVESRRNQP